MGVDARPEGWASDEKLTPMATDVGQRDEGAGIHSAQDFVLRVHHKSSRPHRARRMVAIDGGETKDRDEDLARETEVDRS